MTAPATPAAVEKFNPNRAAPNPMELRRFLEANVGSIQRVAAQVMNPSRMVAILAQAASRNPMLMKCTPLSLLRCLASGAELGLEVAGGLQEFHAVPYWNSELGVYEAQGIPGYPGLVKLVLQMENIARVEPRVVYEGDQFDYELGDAPRLKHKPSMDHLGEDLPDDKIRAFYAVAFFKDGTSQFEVMGKAAVDKLKERAQGKKKNKESGPWITDYAEMGIKTALRKLCKRLPKSAALAKALDLQAAAESGDFKREPFLTVLPQDSPLEGEPSKGAEGGDGQEPGAGSTSRGTTEYAYGPACTEKQINAAKGHADRLKLDHDSSRRVLAAVSHSSSKVARGFMDAMFSKDDAVIRGAFEGHEAWKVEPSNSVPADSQTGAAGPSEAKP